MQDRKIRIVPSFSGGSHSLICFGTQIPAHEVREYDTVFTKQSHVIFDSGALRMFYERIVMGQKFPQTLIITEFQNPIHVLASLLFLHPEDTLNPLCSGLVNSFDMIDRLGTPAMSHIPYEHKVLYGTMKNFMRQREKFPETEWYSALLKGVQTLRAFLETGRAYGEDETDFKILKSEGSVTSFTSSYWPWDMVWNDGTLCGVWVKENGVQIRTKSSLVTPHLKDLGIGKIEGDIVEMDTLNPVVWELLITHYN